MSTKEFPSIIFDPSKANSVRITLHCSELSTEGGASITSLIPFARSLDETVSLFFATI